MKRFIARQKSTVFFFLTLLILFSTSHTGYGQAGDPPLTDANSAPVFNEDESTTRTVAENTASSENIGTAFTATDAENDTLTYALSGTDAASFSIDTTTGQLQTSTALDFETKSSYSVTVSVSDGNNGSNAIDVTINVTDVNESPVLSEGTSATRTIAENTAAGTNIGAAFTATDPDSGDTLTYSLRRDDREAFQIDPNTGQVQTRAALDYETKNAYTDLAVRVTDSGGLRDVILVTINVTDVNEAPVFTEGASTTRTIAENTASGENIGSVVAATYADNDTLTYALSGTDAASFSIDTITGQLQTNTALDFETKSSYSVTVSVSDGNGGSGAIDITINVTNVNEAPVLSEDASATRTVAENTAAGTNIGAAFTATDPDSGDTLTYSLRRDDREAFQIDPNTGQVQTKAPLDYETKNTYDSLAVRVTDSGGLTDVILVTITVTDVNEAPVFTEGASTTRTVAENTASGENIGTAVAATDADTGDTLTYTLSGTDASSFSIVNTTGQLQTSTALDFETKTSYSLTLTVSDGSLMDSIDITINVTDVANNAPVFTDGISTTRTIAENTASGENIGTAFTATDADNDTLIYALSGTDAASFSIGAITGQLQTNTALDFETKSSYSVTVSVSDGNGGSNAIDITINVSNVNEAPAFSEGTRATRTVAENTAAGTNIGAAFTATDPDNGDILTYSLRRDDREAFQIDPNTGQVQTRAALDYETKSTYDSLAVRVTDSGGLRDVITVTINVTDVDENRAPAFTDGETTTHDARARSVSNSAPVFTEGDTATRTIAENTASGINIGNPIVATDADTGDTLTYSLGGTDAASFSIVSMSGQLQTRAALDHETKASYTVTVSVSDGNDGSDSITVTINVTDVAQIDPPLSERTPQVRDVIVAAADVDNADDVTEAHLAAITELDLSGKGITSLKSGDFSGLTALIYLHLHTNSISDISVLKELASLKTLDLSYTSITDISVLADLTALTHLYLVYTSISDISVLEDLTSLKTLDLSYTSTSDISTLADLTALTRLRLWHNSISDISTLEGLTALVDLDLKQNSISDVSALEGLTALKWLNLSGNPISDYGPLRRLKAAIQNAGNSINIDINITNNPPTAIDPPLSERTQQVRDVIVSAVDVDSVEDVTPAHLATISALSLNSTGITTLKTGDFAGLTSLQYLYMNRNSISDISALEGLTALRWLSLSRNSISDVSVLSGLTSLKRLQLNNNSISDVSALEDLIGLKELFIRGNPISDYGPLRRLKLLGTSIDLPFDNKLPVFADGDNTTRAIAENTASGINIGAAVAATDADPGNTLTYTLGGTDAESFSIVSTSGQLQTKAALDYETKNAYTVTVTVYDGNSGGDSITVTINVTDVVNAAPSVQVSPIIPENTALLTNYPNPFNPETWIPYHLAEPADVTLTIYDIRGVVVRELKLGHQAAGVYESRSRAIHWDGRNEVGEKVSTGVYFYTLNAGDFTATRKLLIRK
ncbi:hypothetical protein C6496_24015 [Candidatus Poribacteria bacterium]|nr:MAG: hypothetical protein C6496_24015 [Candidatus Poribacteria bacterium]